MISAKFVPLKYYTLSSQLRRLTSFSVGLFGSANSVTRSYPVMRKSCIDSLASNKRITYRDVFQNGVNALSKNGLKKKKQKQKQKTFFGPKDLVLISLACGKNVFKE